MERLAGVGWSTLRWSKRGLDVQFAAGRPAAVGVEPRTESRGHLLTFTAAKWPTAPDWPRSVKSRSRVSEDPEICRSRLGASEAPWFKNQSFVHNFFDRRPRLQRRNVLRLHPRTAGWHNGPEPVIPTTPKQTSLELQSWRRRRLGTRRHNLSETPRSICT